MTTNVPSSSDAQPELMTMSLEAEYRSSGVGLARDFLAHVLPATRRYQRAVGFFNSSVFGVASDAWGEFFELGGVVQLVCSECFSPTDLIALRRAVTDRPRWRRRQMDDLLPPREGSGNSDLLSWLVANDRLQIKVAFLDPGSGYSLYHEKIGIFEDAVHTQVAISGSANESANAWQGNFERLDVFTSWGEHDASERCRNIRRAFNALWLDDTGGVRVVGLVDCILSGRLRAIENADVVSTPQRPFATTPGGEDLGVEPRPIEALVPPTDVVLFEHQQRAISAWIMGNGRGILEMATGSGKTITALHAASILYDGIGPGMAIVIVAPFIHLMDQWISIARTYGLRPIRCAEGLGSWQAQLGAGIDAINAQRRGLLSIVTTAATMGTATFKGQVSRIHRPLLFVGDEAHNYGTASSAAALPANAKFRLGLSATPTRWMDEDGTDRIEKYFGPVVYQYGLADGIRDRILTPYRYYPQFVDFTDTEFDAYIELSDLIRRYAGASDPDGQEVSEATKSLLIRRARLVASARGKIDLLRQLLEARRKDHHMLIYCGDGSVEGDNDEGMHRQVEAVTRMLGSDLGIRCASYTSRTSPSRRRELIQEFDEGSIQALVAIRCLDEGVDIPSTRTAFILASSTNPRQFVQRRGRVLRRHASKTRAEIYDFFVTPPAEDMVKGSPGYSAARTLVRSQVHRAAEFASLAENGPIARGALVEIMAPLHLLDIWS
jgi:DNA phosphorothioation system restriction enzyme